jgi:hypothetical protein
MKRIVTIASAALLALSAVGLLALNTSGSNNATSVRLNARPPATAHEDALALDKSVDVDFAADSATLSPLTRREREDQYRDWLLYAVIASMGKSTGEFNRILFDLPPLRQGYLRPIGIFDFGQSRSRYVSDGDVVALVPATDDTAQRHDDLAAVADQHRKNLGGDFKRVLVVEYKLDIIRGRASLTRRADVTQAQLLSPAFGYVERHLTSLADLERFVQEVDDLTVVRMQSNGILAGGRKLQKPQRTISIEQIATLWQAEREIQAKLGQWEAYASEVETNFNQRWANRTASSSSERAMLKSQIDTEAAQTREELRKEYHNRKLVGGAGFSLDPAVDFLTLRAQFDKRWPVIAGTGGVAIGLDPKPVSEGLAQKDIVPLLKMIRTLQQNEDGALASMLLTKMQQANSYQAARYDGNLQGTEVGMVLFYTDLIAKLWTIDFADSSPARGMIRGFVDDPGAARSLSAIYLAEGEELSQARLWFGPSALGYQLTEKGNALYFSRVATRIFSAGANVERPDAETQTSMFLAASIDWWNDHYEEVAREEPEYQRLNQIMKWSAVLGWLNGNSQGKLLGFLEPVPVDHSKIFGEWVKQHPELRFQDWHEVGFYPAGYKGSTTEALPLLSGPVTRGGVSLANKQLVRQPSIAVNSDALSRRSNLNYLASADKSTLTTLDDTVYTFRNGGPGRSQSIVANAKADTKLRAETIQLQPAATERIVTAQNADLLVETRVADAALGSLRIGRAPNGFSVGWKAQDIERAHELGRRMSRMPNPEEVLLSDPSIEAVIKFEQVSSYAAKLHGSPRWIRFEPESAPRVDIDPAWQMRAAASDIESIRVMQMKILDEATLVDAFNRGHFIVQTDKVDKAVLRWSTKEPAAGTRMVAVETNQGKLQAWLDADGALNLKIAPTLRRDVLTAARSLRAEDVTAIRNAAVRGDVASIRVNGNAHMSPLANALDKRDFRDAAARIAADPGQSAKLLKQRISEDVARIAEIHDRRGLAAALHDMDALIARNGPMPELLLRRGLLQIERGNVADAASTVGRPMFRGLTDRSAFFDEVNARLKRGSPVGDDVFRYAQFVDHGDLAMHRADAAGTLSARPRAGRFDFDMKLNHLSFEAIDNASRMRPGVDAVIYYQDTVSLNRIDWSAPVHQALNEVISGRLGKVIRLPRGSAADYRPSSVWTPDMHTELKQARPQARREIARESVRGYQACPSDPQPDSCNSTGREENPPDVYLVLASSK